MALEWAARTKRLADMVGIEPQSTGGVAAQATADERDRIREHLLGIVVRNDPRELAKAARRTESGVAMGVTCFMLEPANRAKVGLRRFVSSGSGEKCPLPHGSHEALAYLDEVPITWLAERPERAHHWVTDRAGPGMRYGIPDFAFPGHDDPRWPAACDCGRVFGEGDPHQEWSESLYRRGDTGELITLRHAPDGAMWDATWMPEIWRGPDGRALMVKCPGGHEWHIDGRASNCTMPGDNVHKCWVRHGEPPVITVDKNGPTCAAGAGSIVAGDYHGFLQNGQFT
jgi:hypothetical protein